MKHRSGYLIAILVIVVAVAVSAFTAAAAKPAVENRAASRWEHLALTHNSAVVGDRDLSKRIVGLGDKGWELVSVSTVVKDGTTVKTVFCFKRPK